MEIEILKNANREYWTIFYWSCTLVKVLVSFSYRSSKSSYRKREDDTPRFTPTHKYNEWADDRKKGGWTPASKRSPGTWLVHDFEATKLFQTISTWLVHDFEATKLFQTMRKYFELVLLMSTKLLIFHFLYLKSQHTNYNEVDFRYCHFILFMQFL